MSLVRSRARHKATTPRRPIDPWGAGLMEAQRVADLEAARRNTAVAPMQTGIESPFPHDSVLNSVVWADLTGAPFTQLTRAGAMSIPAVARQRHLLCGAVAACPLEVFTRDIRLEPQPTWTQRTDRPLSPFHRMLWTADDCLFTGWSLWTMVDPLTGQTTGRGSEGQLLWADRVPMERWEVDSITGYIKVDGEVMSADQVILIPGPHEGILNFGAGALKRMLDNLDAAANAARNPSAYLELHYDGDEPLTPAQILTLRTDWAEARRGEFGGVAFTGKNLTVIEHGTHESALLIEGRNADAVDASRLVSSPAAMADATNAGASLTYETTSGRNGQFLDYGAKFYMDAIGARLSMDDVTPRGTRTAFDTTQLTIASPSPTGAPTDD